ncbi:MAG TPA: MFS transporter [Stellaceae bacterium]|jgi:MFS family permease
MATPTALSPDNASPWSPFRHRAFAVLWTATVISNVGTWMQSAGAGWLMTSLDPQPLTVALVQLATALPMFLLALPAGALADIVDRRRLLLGVQIVATAITAVLALLVARNLVTPGSLLLFTGALGVTSALIAPAWQSIVPLLVPRSDLPPAVALGSVGVNVSRAVGPALAGVIIGALDIAAPFWINAASNLIVIAALLWWRSAAPGANPLPPERFTPAMVIGLRHARFNPLLRATLVRAAFFFPLASAYWALLPLVARQQVAGGPALYGLLLGTIGCGAVAGALALPRIKARFGADWVAGGGMIGTALALGLFGAAREPVAAFVASAVAGLAWIAVLATINVSAQIALPAWVRGRGLAIYVTVMFGGLTIGSYCWGQIAAWIGISAALIAAAVILLATLPIAWRWKLASGAGIDLTPSAHWPAPVLAGDVAADRGPVLVTVEYRIRPEDRAAFLTAMDTLRRQRRRDGAYDWRIYEDAAHAGCFVETFYLSSWLEHLRQHQRVTEADRVAEAAVARLHIGDAPPRVTHLIAAQPDGL